MNKLAQLQLAKELLAQEYLQKQAALEEMVKEAVSIAKIYQAAENSIPGRLRRNMGAYIDTRYGSNIDKSKMIADWLQELKTTTAIPGGRFGYIASLLGSPSREGYPLTAQMSNMLGRKLGMSLRKGGYQTYPELYDIVQYLVNKHVQGI